MERNKTECLLLISIGKIKNAETENLKVIKKRKLTKIMQKRFEKAEAETKI